MKPRDIVHHSEKMVQDPDRHEPREAGEDANVMFVKIHREGHGISIDMYVTCGSQTDVAWFSYLEWSCFEGYYVSLYKQRHASN